MPPTATGRVRQVRSGKGRAGQVRAGLGTTYRALQAGENLQPQSSVHLSPPSLSLLLTRFAVAKNHVRPGQKSLKLPNFDICLLLFA